MSYFSTVLADSPSFLWELQETSGTAAADATANNYTGTYNGGYTQGTAGPPGVAALAVTLGGVNGYIFANATQSLSGTFTIECWFKTTVGSSMIGGDNGSNFASASHSRSVYIDSNNNLGFFCFGSNSTSYNASSSGTAYNDGKWHYLAATVDSGNLMHLYADGVQAGSTQMAAAPHVDTFFWLAGTDSISTGGGPTVSNGVLTGGLCAWAVYPAALTAAQVAAHYAAAFPAAGSPRPVPADESRLIRRYRHTLRRRGLAADWEPEMSWLAAPAGMQVPPGWPGTWPVELSGSKQRPEPLALESEPMPEPPPSPPPVPAPLWRPVYVRPPKVVRARHVPRDAMMPVWRKDGDR